MLSLRFPNSSFRAKRGGGVVNHGQPPCRTGRPRLGPDQGPCKGGATDCGQGQPAREASGSQQGWPPLRPAPSPLLATGLAPGSSPLRAEVTPASTAACSVVPVRGADYRTPARDCCPRPALSPAGATAPIVGVAAPWQSGCRWARAVAASVGAVVTATAKRGQEGLGHPF
ncbi:hypothetical protein BHE74_00025360 [Ensete ventricosum]|nr:hypothetical protein BHE74_00025360 [Ensete ventricosum]